jgi:hypothetical protein
MLKKYASSGIILPDQCPLQIQSIGFFVFQRFFISADELVQSTVSSLHCVIRAGLRDGVSDGIRTKLNYQFIPTKCTECQLSGLHSIMMKKLTQAGEDGGVHARFLSLHLPSRTKLWCELQREGRYTPPISTLSPCSLCSYPL